jgi:hypothetical protein
VAHGSNAMDGRFQTAAHNTQMHEQSKFGMSKGKNQLTGNLKGEI